MYSTWVKYIQMDGTPRLLPELLENRMSKSDGVIHACPQDGLRFILVANLG